MWNCTSPAGRRCRVRPDYASWRNGAGSISFDFCFRRVTTCRQRRQHAEISAGLRTRDGGDSARTCRCSCLDCRRAGARHRDPAIPQSRAAASRGRLCLSARRARGGLWLQCGREWCAIRRCGQTREDAFATYDDALSEGHGAFLLDEERPDIFCASVGSILPGSDVQLELTYVTELMFEGDALRFTLPTTVAPRFAPAEDRVGVGRPDSEALNPPHLKDVPYRSHISGDRGARSTGAPHRIALASGGC